MNRILYNKLGVILFITLFSAVKVNAQSGTYVDVADLETWTSVGAKLELNKTWEFSLSEQLRLKRNSAQVDQYFTHLNINYVGGKHIEIGTAFRFIRENDTKGDQQGYETHSRFQFDVKYKHKIERLSLQYRLRYQHRNEWGISKDEGDDPIKHWRLKAGAKYNFKDWKFDPEMSAEIFRRYETGEQTEYNKLRWTLGTSYKMKTVGTFDLFYRIERTLNQNYPKTTYIIGLGYVYNIKIKSKNEE
jgi:hypothetical protein